MDAAGVAPNSWFYNAFVDACAELKFPDEAFAAVARMQAQSPPVVPDTILYTSLVKACWRVGDTERAWDTYNAMRIAGNDPDVITYNTMIRIAADTKVGCGAWLGHAAAPLLCVTLKCVQRVAVSCMRVSHTIPSLRYTHRTSVFAHARTHAHPLPPLSVPGCGESRVDL